MKRRNTVILENLNYDWREQQINYRVAYDKQLLSISKFLSFINVHLHLKLSFSFAKTRSKYKNWMIVARLISSTIILNTSISKYTP